MIRYNKDMRYTTLQSHDGLIIKKAVDGSYLIESKGKTATGATVLDAMNVLRREINANQLAKAKAMQEPKSRKRKTIKVTNKTRTKTVKVIKK